MHGHAVGRPCTHLNAALRALVPSLFRSDVTANAKGGVIILLKGEDWDETPGPTAILRNSTFKLNTAEFGNAGVVHLDGFSTLVVDGDENVFEGNTCGEDGGVFGGEVNTNITVEGGVFERNDAKAVGGCV